MSGIYIKDMETPQEKKITLTIFPDGRVYENHGNRLWGHGKDCIPWKAVPVHDHGDLIERDALVASFQKTLDDVGDKWLCSPTSMAERLRMVADLKRIEAAKTIIPADKEGEDGT